MSLLVLPVAPTWAVIYGEKMEDDKRLDAVAAFGRANWLGIQVGAGQPQKQHNWFGCAVLISPRHIVTARHLLNTKDNRTLQPGFMAVRFRRHEDGTLGSRNQPADTYTNVRIQRWYLPEQGDVALGLLEREVTHIEPMPMVWDLPEDQPFKGLVAGWGSESPTIGDKGPRHGLRVGPNVLMRQGRIIRILQFPVERKEVGQRKDGQPILKAVAKDDGVAMPNMHDSGGALIAVSPDGKLGLVGIIASYQSGTWLGQYAEDDQFPLKDWASTKPE